MTRRSTGGTAPSPVEVVPAMRPGWSGGKPPPGSLQRDIAGRGRSMAEAVPSFSDDEDYLRGRELQQRHEREERERKRHEPPPSEDEEEDDETEDEGAGGLCICDTQPRANCVLHGASVLPLARASALTRLTPPPPPAPVPLQRQVAAITGSGGGGAAEEPSSSSNVSTLMESAVREAFRQGIEQGKRMQLPQQCKTCAVRKERNRLAAKESRHKKRREAEVVATRELIATAADVAASRVTAPPPTPVPSAPAPLATSARAAAGGGEEEELVPPPF